MKDYECGDPVTVDGTLCKVLAIEIEGFVFRGAINRRLLVGLPDGTDRWIDEKTLEGKS